MKLKKLNAALSLLTILFLLLHLVYVVFSYLMFYYNPFLTKLFAVPTIVFACLHSVLGMSLVFLQGDGTRLDLYPRQNLRTILQRLSAALFFPLLILHIQTFEMLQNSASQGNWFLFALLLLAEICFFGVIITHVAVSMTRALITLGWLRSKKTQEIIDHIIWIVSAVVFLVASVVVVKTQLFMFLD